MHFSIPDTQEFDDSTGTTYLAYNIHINGLFHCTVRYKQLLNLHEQLSKDLDIPLPHFPPKKFFPLTANQQEDRRLALERYIQTIGQNTAINNSELLNGFLLNAQQETGGRATEDENFDVFLMNGQTITVKVSTADNSNAVLKKVCRHLKLREQFDIYFALFVTIVSEEGQINVIRRLQDFESPLMTQTNIGAIGVKVMLSKGYWDIGYDMELMRDSAALDLLYIQTLSEIERGCIVMNDEMRDRLQEAQNRGGKKAFMEVARSLKHYGYLNFVPCYCDYPQPGTKVLVAIGRNELTLRVLGDSGEEEQDATFKVTRMRCWRITTLQNGVEKSEETSDYSLELSFEYLMARNQLQWITVASEQAILMSVCLQAMIDELLLKNVGGNKTAEVSGKSWTYIMRDGHSRLVIGSASNENINAKASKEEEGRSRKTEPVIKKLAERFSAGRSRSFSENRMTSVGPDLRRNNDCDITENNAFHMIGDDDL